MCVYAASFFSAWSWNSTLCLLFVPFLCSHISVSLSLKPPCTETRSSLRFPTEGGQRNTIFLPSFRSLHATITDLYPHTKRLISRLIFPFCKYIFYPSLHTIFIVANVTGENFSCFLHKQKPNLRAESSELTCTVARTVNIEFKTSPFHCLKTLKHE